MPVPQQRAAIERHLLRDTAYDALCTAIVSGTLAPGERLHDEELCSWLGLSRTPVRDALGRLEDEGLIETAPQRYTQVTPLRAADAQHTFPVLAVVHGLATELAVPRLGDRDFAQLDEANDAFMAGLRDGDRAALFAAAAGRPVGGPAPGDRGPRHGGRRRGGRVCGPRQLDDAGRAPRARAGLRPGASPLGQSAARPAAASAPVAVPKIRP
jgi:hypothetical protein